MDGGVPAGPSALAWPARRQGRSHHEFGLVAGFMLFSRSSLAQI